MNVTTGEPAFKTDPAHGTPPDRRILLPLTPPSTVDAHPASTPGSPVSATFELIRNCKQSELGGRRVERKLQASQYEKLLSLLDKDSHLKGVADDKLRYATD
jgi:hypothetical protein